MPTQAPARRLALASESRRIWASCREWVLKIPTSLKRGRADLNDRWQFDEFARSLHGEDSRLKNALVLVHMCRDAMASAQRQSPEALAETKAKVAATLMIVQTETFRGFEMPTKDSVLDAVAKLVVELGEAQAAAAVYAANPTPMNQAVAIEENSEAMIEAQSFMASVARGTWGSPAHAA